MTRWNGGDAEHVGLNGLHPGVHHHLRSRSRRSSFDGTVRLSDAESMDGFNHGVRCNSCSQVRSSLFNPFGDTLKAVNRSHVEGDYRHSISMRELSFDTTPVQSGMYTRALIQVHTFLTSNHSANRVTANHTWSMIPPTYSSNFPDRWIVP